MPQTRLTIVVSGMVAADPHQGGATWAVLQYVLGLRELGHRVLLIDPIPAERVGATGAALETSPSGQYFRNVTRDFGLEESAALLIAGSQTTVGLPYRRCEAITREAEVLINISGMLHDENLLAKIPCRVYLDLDPAFIQCWHAQGIDMHLDGHTHFVTIGQAIGEPNCPVPTCGRRWLKTLPPTILSRWPVAERIMHNALTTIGNWRGYGSVENRGVHFGQKAHSLRQFFELPARTPEEFLLAMAIDPGEVADLQQLDRWGWRRIDPALVAATPQAYQQFIQASKAEFGIAKSGYVASRCGWFSDRSTCYLASGRPVIAQNTGFPACLPTGAGLFAFRTSDDVMSAIDALHSDYHGHCRAARELAQTYFDSRKVLPRLLDVVAASP
jgi:hypothetical protein